MNWRERQKAVKNIERRRKRAQLRAQLQKRPYVDTLKEIIEEEESEDEL